MNTFKSRKAELIAAGAVAVVWVLITGLVVKRDFSMRAIGEGTVRLLLEILNGNEREISVESIEPMLREMVKRLEAETGLIEMSFPYFINKAAPISGVQVYVYDTNGVSMGAVSTDALGVYLKNGLSAGSLEILNRLVKRVRGKV